ncbi:hypothetical protein [Cerasicoccus frondis]|uniref:hypothetical protein n=1 Tax=Cerasicoccus frondis TaxID=490090 RepID=UPI0028528820|nr:hypothetical protein [Cerasicoccus frondis]
MKRSYYSIAIAHFLGAASCLANHYTYFYIIEYDSNLYLSMYGKQQTVDDIIAGNFFSGSGTLTNFTTYIIPSDGLVAFLDSSETADSFNTDIWETGATNTISNVLHGDELDGSSDTDFGSGSKIIFDSGSTYATSVSSLYKYDPTDDAGGYGLVVSTESGYGGSQMAFFSKATGYTLDDVGVTSGYSDYYEEFEVAYGDDGTITTEGYHFKWKVDSGVDDGTQYYEFYLAEVSSSIFLESVIELSGDFSDDQLDDIYDLIFATSSDGDDLLVIPNVPEPSTYAVWIAVLSLGAAMHFRRRTT